MTESALPRLAPWFVASAIAALYAHAIFYTPITYGDQFQESRRTICRNILRGSSRCFVPAKWCCAI